MINQSDLEANTVGWRQSWNFAETNWRMLYDHTPTLFWAMIARNLPLKKRERNWL